MSYLPSLGSSSEVIPYPVSVSGHLSSSGSGSEDGASPTLLTRGCLANNESALLYRGPCLEVLNIQHNERISSQTFSDEITSVDSLGPDQVVIGLNSGVVSVLDIKISKLIKSVAFPQRISSLAVIHDLASRSLAEELMFFKGILAVGTQSGDLYLLDLALDKDSEDAEPVSPLYISPGITTRLADLRQGTQNHLCIHLNDQRKVNAGLVISALSHVPQLGSIAVGYNTGAWKLWNLNRLTTEFTFSSNQPLLPCVGFAFQEPENDPRNHSYLWVMRSENDVDTEDDKKALNTFATIDLYALRYENKDEVDQYGVLYSGLTSCSKSFEFKLTGDPEANRRPKGSLGLTTRTLGMLSSSRQTQLDISGTECDSIYTQGLCIFMWEVRSYNDPNSQYFLGVFDLNMWYQDQMPMEYIEADICPFLSYCSMEDALVSCSDASILDIYVDLASISRCKSSINSEKNSYPSSLAFELIAILDKGFVQTSHLGLQKKVLLELQAEGHSSLVEPGYLYKLCSIAGFVNETNLTTKLDQRSALLTVALEHNLVNLLTGCVSHWNDGKYSDEGCTMRALLDWAWQRIILIKQMIDKVTAPLFDLSSLHFDESYQRTLLQNSQQLHHLCAVIQELISQSVVASQIGFEELQIKMNVVRLVNLYVRVVLWFFSAGLLPELPEPESGSIPLQGRDSPYPYVELSAMYKSKRRQMKILHSDWGYSDVPLLLIDGLCSQFGSKLSNNFERDGGDGLYPPPTLFSILSAYLIDDHRSTQINDVGKHRLIHYLFLDMADKRCNDEIWNEMIDRLIQFPSAFSVPPSIIKLTQAFWLLDQGDFEEAMGMLLDPLILDKDITGWEHRAIIVALLVQDQPKSALKYSRIRKPPVKDAFDIKLHVSVLLSTGNIHEAFQFQRNRRNTCKDLLNYFFIQAEKLGKLNLLFELTLTTFEETEFVKFLQNSESSSEVLLMYYLQRYRFQEALAYHRLLKQKNLSTPTHQALMNRYSSLLPNLLVENKGYDTLKVMGSSKIPVPLSREIKMTNFNPLFHTSIIEEQLENSLGHNASTTVFTPFRPRGQRINPVEKRKFVEVAKPKRDDEDDDLIVQVPPSKKSRFIETRMLLEDHSSPKKVLPLAFTEEVSSILSTPKITRKHLSLRSSGYVDRGQIDDSSSPFLQQTKKTTPSILKNSANNDEDGSTPTHKFTPKNQEDSYSKSLRFSVPKKLPPPELKPVSTCGQRSDDSEVENIEIISSSSSVKDCTSISEENSSPQAYKVSSIQKDISESISNQSTDTSLSSTDVKDYITSKKKEELLESFSFSKNQSAATSHLATPRKPITSYLGDEQDSFKIRDSMDTPRLSESVSTQIQSQLSQKNISEETESEEDSKDEPLVLMSEEESNNESDNEPGDKEFDHEVVKMIKDRAVADAQKFVSKLKSVEMDVPKFASESITKSSHVSSIGTSESSTDIERIIERRVTTDFKHFMASQSSSTIEIVSTSRDKFSRSSTVDSDNETLKTTDSTNISTSATVDFNEIIKQQASLDFNLGRKPIDKKSIIYLENEDKTDDEITPEKIKEKALKSAEEWVKSSPLVSPISPKKLSSTSNEVDDMIKKSAEVDFQSQKFEAKQTIRSNVSIQSFSSSLFKKSDTPFQFSAGGDDDDDSDVLDDDEDEHPIIMESSPPREEQKMEVESNPGGVIEFNFSQPVPLDDDRDDEIVFKFSKGRVIDSPLEEKESDSTDEFENVKFNFSQDLTVVEDEMDNKVEFSFSEPRENPKVHKDILVGASPSKTSEESIVKDTLAVLGDKNKPKVREDIDETRTVRRSKRISQLGGDKNTSEATSHDQSEKKDIHQAKIDDPLENIKDIQNKSASYLKTPLKSHSEAEAKISSSKRSLRSFSTSEKADDSFSVTETGAGSVKKSPEKDKTISSGTEIVKKGSPESPSHLLKIDSTLKTQKERKKSPSSTFTPRKLRSSASEEKELQIEAPLFQKEKVESIPKSSTEKKSSIRISTPRKLRSSVSEERELRQPRRSKRLSHSSVVPVTSSSRQSTPVKSESGSRKSHNTSRTLKSNESLDDSEKDTKDASSSVHEKPSVETDTDVKEDEPNNESKLDVIEEEDEGNQSESTFTSKRSLRSHKANKKTDSSVKPSFSSLEKVDEEQEEPEASNLATPVRKSKRLSAKSQSYDEVKKPPTKSKDSKKESSKGNETLDEKPLDLMYEDEEPFDVSSVAGEKKSPKSEVKSTRRKKYVAKKKVKSQKMFF